VAVQTEERDEDIDLGAMGRTLWSKRAWIALSTVVFFVPFVAAAYLMAPVYRASTLLIDARDNSSASSLSSALSQLGGLASIARVNIPTNASQVDEAMAVMKSREFTQQFIEDEHLLPLLFPKQWDASAGQWRGPKEGWPTLVRGFKAFDAIRDVTQAGRGGLITVTIEWTDPQLAAAWANALVARINSEMRERAIASTNRSVSYLEHELVATSTVETRQAINRLMETQINQRMLANVTQEYAFRVVDRALPPEPNDMVRPRKLLLIAIGPTIGLVFGIFAVLVFNAFAARRSRSGALATM
jgi:uncharacterized protein involved in exopolysaccharide biosynthesis